MRLLKGTETDRADQPTAGRLAFKNYSNTLSYHDGPLSDHLVPQLNYDTPAVTNAHDVCVLSA